MSNFFLKTGIEFLLKKKEFSAAVTVLIWILRTEVINFFFSCTTRKIRSWKESERICSGLSRSLFDSSYWGNPSPINNFKSCFKSCSRFSSSRVIFSIECESGLNMSLLKSRLSYSIYNSSIDSTLWQSLIKSDFLLQSLYRSNESSLSISLYSSKYF